MMHDIVIMIIIVIIINGIPKETSAVITGETQNDYCYCEDKQKRVTSSGIILP